ncbi:MAG TPA: DUF5924 family protein [Steroidobacteraceae bacterium]|nr:DUF5924 family protein [Steroidobacteraceae bacterium]
MPLSTNSPSPDASRLISWVTRIATVLRRFPWVVPALSFAAGWGGFLMVRRGASFAQIIASIALIGWVWLLIEPFVRRFLERRQEGVGNFVANFLTQSIEQEMLFFCLPLIIGATQKDVGQIAFTALAAIAALLSTLDYVYERYIATRAATRLLFHAYCSLIAAIVVLPMVMRMPFERAFPLAIFGVSAWLLLTLPMSLKSLSSARHKSIWILASLAAPLLLWILRSHVPAAGLVVTQGIITQTIDELTPGPAVTRLTSAQLSQGVVAFVAIRAPRGVAQTVMFEWQHGTESERIVAEIHGGNESGWRTFARKQSFPENSRGKWTVDILSPQRQLLKRLSFEVE